MDTHPWHSTLVNRPCSLLLLLVPVLALLLVNPAWAADPPTPEAVGIAARVAWTTSRIAGTPEPPLPYTTERVFPQLKKFDRCLDIAAAPGSDRLWVVEQTGKIYSFENRADVKSADLAIDTVAAIDGVRTTYSIAFHPQFAENRFCYVCCIKAPDTPDGSEIVRLTVSRSDPPTIDPASRRTVITWPSSGHNGCCLRFGPDGCLYISTGDGSGPNPPDGKRAGQDISNLLSCILRIDVDRRDEGLGYHIPEDNPFVGTADARGEIWAYGFRNPWRMSFDRKTGDLWVGDVGWELWELLDRVERGGNYGWSVMEGRQPTNSEWPQGPTPVLPPTIDHPHTESSSITDGLTYYGSRLKDLHGAHIYSDYDTGKFWAFRWQDGKVVEHREIADTTHRVAGFGEDHAGELYVLDHTAGTIHRLIENAARGDTESFPRRLSETGLFQSVSGQTPAPGVIPYSIRAQPWADHASSKRLLAVPGQGTIKVADKTTWTFPADSVLVKTLSLEMSRGEPSSRRRIETQILHFHEGEWRPYSYRWNDEQTDATLLPAAGGQRVLEVADADAPNGLREQTWRFASRSECLRCHNKWSGPPLAFNLPQLNKPHPYAAGAASQLETLAHVKLITPPPPADKRPQLADPRDPTAPLDDRARGYLQVNCAHCHRLHAGGAVLAKMHYDVPLPKTNMLGARPTQGGFGIHGAKVLAPGDPLGSVLLYRMAKLGGGRMPRLGSSEVDRDGVALIHRWIAALPPGGNGDNGDDANDDDELRRREAELLAGLGRGGPGQRKADVQQLLASTSGALMLLQAVDRGELAEDTARAAVDSATAHEDVRVRDLFERFLPVAARTRRLGSVVAASQILPLAGDPSRGKQVFFNTAGVACKNCHRIQQQGAQVGPDLTQIGAKQTRAQLLESILEPARRIDPKYVTYLIETTQGKVLTGVLVRRDAEQIVIVDAKGQRIELASDDIERVAPQRTSLMPELQVRDLTAQQVADLLAYLHGLKQRTLVVPKGQPWVLHCREPLTHLQDALRQENLVHPVKFSFLYGVPSKNSQPRRGRP